MLHTQICGGARLPLLIHSLTLTPMVACNNPVEFFPVLIQHVPCRLPAQSKLQDVWFSRSPGTPTPYVS